MEKRSNCWDYMKCERQPGGEKVVEFGIVLKSTEHNDL